MTLSTGELGWTLTAPITVSGTGPWTFDTSGASLEEVQALVKSLSVTPPAGFDGEIAVTVQTTTAEAATEDGPNPGSDKECDETDNVDVDVYPFTVVVNPTTEPPETTLGVEGGGCLKEDTQGALAFSAAPEGDDRITNIGDRRLPD